MSHPRSSFRYRANRSGDHALVKRRRRWPWIVSGVLVALVLVLGAFGVVFAREALSVRDDLMAAKERVSQIATLASAGDGAGMARVAEEALALTTRADETVDGPLWSFAASIPVVGTNVAAVQSATEATHILVRDAVPIAVRILGNIDPNNLEVEGGGIDLEPFRLAQADLPEISAAFNEAKGKIDPVDLEALHPVVSDALRELVEVIDKATPVVQMLEKYLPTIIQMLGGEGERTYMVLFQNNAELRATGGNPGSMSVMTADNGKIETREDATVAYAHWLGRRSDIQPAEVPPETLALYEYDFAIRSQNYTRTPNFPTSASLFDGLWTLASGAKLDGVLAVDPVLLAKMLEVTGPVVLDDGTEINSQNAVSTLLFDVYERFGVDGEASDAYFADVADRVFTKVTSGGWDPLAMFDALAWGVDQQRIYGWFPRESEQQLAHELGIDGALSVDNTQETQLGVFVNDASYSKLEYFYTQEIAVSCDLNAGTMTTSITMHNNITDPNLNGYTLAWRNNSLGIPRTTMLLDVLYFAPPGSTIVGFDPSGGDLQGWDRSGVENGHAVQSLAIALPMGETRTVTYTSTIPAGELGPVALRYTPGVAETPVSVGESCGGI